MTDPTSAEIEELAGRMGQPLPVCPYDRRSPDYLTAPDDKPCIVCGSENEAGAPDLCRGADTRIYDRAAALLRSLAAKNAELEAWAKDSDAKWLAAERRADAAETQLATLRAEKEAVEKERDEANFDRMREWMDASYHLKYPVTPEVLEFAAEHIDCGGDCATVWREWDTGFSGCSKSETDEGCPFDMAVNLRDFAKALRTQAAEPEGVDWKTRAEAAERLLEEERAEAIRVLEPVTTICVRVGWTTREDVDRIHAATALLTKLQAAQAGGGE